MTESVKTSNQARRRVYGGILIFSVAVGITLTGVPALRARMVERVHILKTAMTGEIQMDILPIGENDIPYPEEFMRPRPSAPAARPPVIQANNQSIRPPALLGMADSRSSINSNDEGDDDDKNNENEIRFQQGEIELEVYEKTLAVNEKLAGMTLGGNSELSLKTWGVTHRNEDIYWVRVVFQNASGAEVEYIWETNITSGRSVPLNFNARNLVGS